MIVYLPHGAFGASKMTKKGFISREFLIGDNVSQALSNAIAWEKRGRTGDEEEDAKKSKLRSKRPTRKVGEPRFISVYGDECVQVPYIDKNGRRSKVQQRLPSVGADEVVQRTVNRARAMAGLRPLTGAGKRSLA